MGLITNFSSGELSSNLYGRIDLPQYHSGAARLENWDIIPTGGIKRRSGMERLCAVENGEGKDALLVPFIISREENYLLLFTNERISVYKAGENSPRWTFTSENIKPEKLYSENEIPEAQYAQDYDTMIFTHKNHPPLEIKIDREGGALIHTLEMDFEVPVIANKDMPEDEKKEFENEKDRRYKNNGWLTTPGNYPGAVCFLNGRLVFAGTHKNTQRVFVSSVKETDKPYNFATYKKFLAVKREYSTLFGKIDNEDTRFLVCSQGYSVNNFGKPPEEYYVDSRLYPPYPQTRISEINLNRVKFTKGVKNGVVVLPVDDILEILIDKEVAFFNNDENGTEFLLYHRYWTGYGYDAWKEVNYHVGYDGYFTCKVKAKSIEFYSKTRTQNNYGIFDDFYLSYRGGITIHAKDLEEYIEDPRGEKKNYIIDEINKVINSWTTGYPFNPLNNQFEIRPNKYEPHNENITLAAGKLFDNLLSTCFYELDLGEDGIEKYYNLPGNLSAIISGRIINSDHTYIAVFSQEIIVDEYPTPDCGYTFEIASGKNDAIKWLSVNRGIVIGSELSEYVMPPDVHATTPPYVVALSKHGSGSIPGEAVGMATLFFQSGCKGLVEYYPNDDDHFRANNMALLAQQMLRESPAKEFDFTTAPYTRLFITRDDGALVTLLYERGTGTFAWNRITTGEVIRDLITPEEIERARKLKDQYKNSTPYSYDHSPFNPPEKLERFIEGKILTCAALSGDDGYDDVYMIVERDGKFFLERLREAGTVYLDSWREWKFNNDEEKQELLKGYGGRAVVYDEEAVEVYKLDDPEKLPASSEKNARRYIGYPYRSVMMSMPVVNSEKMGPVNMNTICVRFLDSYEPRIWGNECSKSELNKTVHNGVIKETNTLSGQNRTLQFYITHDAPNRCCVLSVYTEV